MPRQRLTLPRIAAFKPKGEGFLWDEDMPRLAVRARASGSKTFIFKGTLDYKDIRVTIGSTDVWTIEAAREEARRYQRWIDERRDPRDVLRQEAEARAAEEAAAKVAQEAARAEEERLATPALGAWNAYLEARAARWSPRTLLDHRRLSDPGGKTKTRGRKKGEGDTTQPGILRPLLAQPLTNIDARTVRAFLKDEVHRPTQASNAFTKLRAFLNWCADRPEYAGQVHTDACAGRIARDELPRRTAKDDCLQREMLRPWFEHVRRLSNPVQAAYLQVLLLTGARREELACLRWEDVDFKWGSLTMRDKREPTRTIPLTPYLAGLLLDLKRRNDTPPPSHRILHGKRIANDQKDWKPSPWVFASPGAKSGRIQEPRIGHKRALATAGLPDLTLHGLRRSFGTLAEWCEVPVGVVAQIQGHKPSAIAEKHYRRRPLDLLRMWHTRIEGWILTEAGIEQPGQESAPGLRAVASA